MILLYMKNPALCWWVSFPFLVRTVHRTGATLVTYRINSNSCAVVFIQPNIPSSQVCVHLLLHKLFPRSCSIHRPCVTVRNSVFLYGKQLLHVAQSPCWKTTTVCWLSMTGHSVYLQLPSMSASHSIQQPRHGDSIGYIVLLFLIVIWTLFFKGNC
jgi:hypothetical protein